MFLPAPLDLIIFLYTLTLMSGTLMVTLLFIPPLYNFLKNKITHKALSNV